MQFEWYETQIQIQFVTANPVTVTHCVMSVKLRCHFYIFFQDSNNVCVLCVPIEIDAHSIHRHNNNNNKIIIIIISKAIDELFPPAISEQILSHIIMLHMIFI